MPDPGLLPHGLLLPQVLGVAPLLLRADSAGARNDRRSGDREDVPGFPLAAKVRGMEAGGAPDRAVVVAVVRAAAR